MTAEEIIALDAVDRAERFLREVAADSTLTVEAKNRKILEAIRDDAFADFQDLVGADLPFDAYWDDETQAAVDQPLGPGAPPMVFYVWRKHDPDAHPFWRGKYPHRKKVFATKPEHFKKAAKDGEKVYRTPSPAKIAATPSMREALTPERLRQDDDEILELVMLGVL
jgi:hypothetical protein